MPGLPTNSLIIDLSGSGGLAPKFWGDSDQTTTLPNTRYFDDSSAMAEGFFNPWMRNGYLSPAVSTLATLSAGTPAATLASVSYDTVNNLLYFAERGQQIFEYSGLDSITGSQVLDLGASGTPVIQDLEIYRVNDVRKLFFVYETGGNLQVGISNLPYNTVNDDLTWLTATTSGAFTNTTASNYNFIRTADNGFAYLFADNAVHKIDGTTNGGTNGTVTANALLFPPYFRLTDAIDYRGLMFIGVHQTTTDPVAISLTNVSTPCGIYVWDRLTSIVNTRDYIPLAGVLQIRKIYVAPDGQLRLMVVAANGLTQIREYDGSKFTTIKELGLGAAPQFPDGLCTAIMHTLWIGTDGTIYGHGKINPGDPEILAKIGTAKSTSSTVPQSTVTAGAIFFGGSNSFSAASGYRTDRQGLTFTYTDSGSFLTKRLYPFDIGSINNHDQTALAGNIYTGVYNPYEVMGYTHFPHTMSTIGFIDLLMSTGSTSTSDVQATISIYFNGSTTPWASKSVTRADIAKGYKRIEVNKPYVHSIQLKIVYQTGVVLSDTYDFHPRHAVVHYTPTPTRG